VGDHRGNDIRRLIRKEEEAKELQDAICLAARK